MWKRNLCNYYFCYYTSTRLPSIPLSSSPPLIQFTNFLQFHFRTGDRNAQQSRFFSSQNLHCWNCNATIYDTTSPFLICDACRKANHSAEYLDLFGTSLEKRREVEEDSLKGNDKDWKKKRKMKLNSDLIKFDSLHRKGEMEDVEMVKPTSEVCHPEDEAALADLQIRSETDTKLAFEDIKQQREMENLEKSKQMETGNELYYYHENKECIANTCRLQEQVVGLSSEQLNERSSDHCSTSKSCSEYNVRDVCRIMSSSANWCVKLEKLEKCNVQFTPELVLEVLQSCSLHGATALQFFSWVGKRTDYNHRTESYNMAIKIAGRGKDFKHMRGLFYEMLRKGCLVTPDTWTIMIMQYGRIGLTEIALSIFRDMKASECIPTESTYKALIVSLCGKKGRKVDEAIKIFSEMMQHGYAPDKELVEAYLACICEVGRVLDEQRCIRYLLKIGFPVPLSYSLYIRALCRAGRLEEAVMISKKVGPERHTLDQYTCGSLIHGLLRKGRLEEAVEKVESLKQVGIHPTVHVYTSLIVYFFKEKHLVKALKVLEEMKEAGCQPTIVTYSALIRGYMNMGKVTDAWNVFHHMKKIGPSPDFKTYSMFITCLCRVGRSQDAFQLLTEMLDYSIVPSTVNFRTVFFGLNREGKHDLAQLVSQMKSGLKYRRKLLT